MYQRKLPALLFSSVLFLIVAGCSSLPDARGSASNGAHLAQEAVRYIGAPYRYGGDTPQGFDCSGLVHYSHLQKGISVPRTAAEQSVAAKPVPMKSLQPGDVIFFSTGSRSVDHVGIYVGKGRFIHAPRSGRVVSYAYLTDSFYAPRITGAGRFW